MDYDLLIKTLHLYYNMRLATFGIDWNENLIIHFPVFVQPYTQQPLVLYQTETGIEVENNFLLESLAACHNANSKLAMYFMMNTAFINHLDKICNLTNTTDIQIIKEQKHFWTDLTHITECFKISFRIINGTQDAKRLYPPV